MDDVISSHKLFLNKFLDTIWAKIEKLLRQFQKELSRVKALINSKIPFDKLVTLAEQRFESIFNSNYLYKKEYLIKCFEKRNEHIRYQNAVDLFIQTLGEYLTEKIEDISNLLIPQKHEAKNTNINVKVEIIYSSKQKSEIVEQKYYNYEFSKLHEKHPIFGLKYFKKHFHEDPDIIEEITNMENNLTNEMEYYSSYEYLRIILLKKGLLKS